MSRKLRVWVSLLVLAGDALHFGYSTGIDELESQFNAHIKFLDKVFGASDRSTDPPRFLSRIRVHQLAARLGSWETVGHMQQEDSRDLHECSDKDRKLIFQLVNDKVVRTYTRNVEVVSEMLHAEMVPIEMRVLYLSHRLKNLDEEVRTSSIWKAKYSKLSKKLGLMQDTYSLRRSSEDRTFQPSLRSVTALVGIVQEGFRTDDDTIAQISKFFNNHPEVDPADTIGALLESLDSMMARRASEEQLARDIIRARASLLLTEADADNYKTKIEKLDGFRTRIQELLLQSSTPHT